MSNEEFKPKQGDMVEVRNSTDVKWVARQFVVTHEGFHYCAGIRYLQPWNHMRPVPTEPAPIPFSHETWPRQPVWIRTGDSNCFMVTGYSKVGINFGGVHCSFEELLRNKWEISLDFCQTWQPCHYVPEDGNHESTR